MFIDMHNRPFIPETQPFYPEATICDLALSCHKKENHKKYKAINELTTDHLPEKWRNEKVLHDLKVLARRVVHLKVTKLSPSREGAYTSEHFGSGFITFDPVHGALINTSKHVVRDPFEAENTIVTLFYDDDRFDEELLEAEKEMKSHGTRNNPEISDIPEETKPGFFMFWGSKDKFRSVLCSDYTVFLCKDLPVHKLFSKQEIENSNPAFSWWKFSLKRLILSTQMDIDIAVISHPHGGQKTITFGKMNRPYNMCTSMYTATTCSGSSGAPVIRFHSDSVHYISAGQFVHNGYWKEKLNKSMGCIRPPITYPYWKRLDSEQTLSRAISILYEPIIYWTLVCSDLLYVESTLNSSMDVFAYTGSFFALLFTVNSLCFRILFGGFLLHMLLSGVKNAHRSNWHYAVCHAISSVISTSMFFISWGLLLILPQNIFNTVMVILVWFIVLYLERYFRLSYKFEKKTIGSDLKLIRYRMAVTMKKKKANSAQ